MKTNIKPKLNHSKDWYSERLRNNVCVVLFEKVDGSERTMICTTKHEIMKDFAPEKATDRVVNVPDHQVRCFDVQKKEWRSFRIDSVISFNITE